MEYLYLYINYCDQKILGMLLFKILDNRYRLHANFYQTFSRLPWMSGKQSGRYLILSSANEFVYNRIRIFSLLFFRNNECYRPKKKRALNFFFRNDISATKKLKYLQKTLKNDCLSKSRWNKTKDITSKSLKNQGYVDRFLWLSRYCALWIPTNWPDSQ